MDESTSILTYIKKLLGPGETYEHFDPDIIMHINSTFGILYQLGVGPKDGFSISDKNAVWTDFLEEGPNLEMVKTYIYQKVKLVFDPPISSIVVEAMKASINEFEWRLNNKHSFKSE